MSVLVGYNRAILQALTDKDVTPKIAKAKQDTIDEIRTDTITGTIIWEDALAQTNTIKVIQGVVTHLSQVP